MGRVASGAIASYDWRWMREVDVGSCKRALLEAWRERTPRQQVRDVDRRSVFCLSVSGKDLSAARARRERWGWG